MRFLLRLLSVLCGLAVAAVGVAVLIGVTWLWTLPDDDALRPLFDRLRSIVDGLSWSSTPVLVTAGIVLAAGLVLLIVTLSAGRGDIRLEDPAPGVTVITSPRSLARLVGHQVRAADGVRGAVVTASRKSVRVKASSRVSRAAALHAELRELTTDTVRDLPMARTPRVSVSVNSAREGR